MSWNRRLKALRTWYEVTAYHTTYAKCSKAVKREFRGDEQSIKTALDEAVVLNGQLQRKMYTLEDNNYCLGVINTQIINKHKDIMGTPAYNTDDISDAIVINVNEQYKKLMGALEISERHMNRFEDLYEFYNPEYENFKKKMEMKEEA